MLQQQEQRKQQQHNISIIAPFAKSILSLPEEQREQAYQQSLPEIQRAGVDISKAPPKWDDNVGMSIMQAGGLKMDVIDAPVERIMPAGTNEKGQNMVVKRLYENNKIIEESAPYVKKEITREADVDASDYGAGGTKSNRFKLMDQRLTARKALYKQTKGIDDVINLVESPDFVGGFIGDSLSNINSLNQGIQNTLGLGSAMVNGKISEDLSESKQFSALRRKAINGDRYSALMIEMAYIKAKMVDPASKITDKDFSFAKRMLASGSDREGILATLKDSRKRGSETYNVNEKLTQKTHNWYEPQPYSEEKYRGLYGVAEPQQVTNDLQSISNEDLLKQLSQ